MEQLIPYLPFLIPIAVIELVLMLTALLHVLRHKNFRIGNKVIWVVLVVVLPIIGPILYFTIGRSDEG